ncbi:hypothetical protein BIV59_05305 [Bacillus sp. MUM 13]|nr:hypothetical protein BIV59_05305 [Bacillus sp. MUM 13]
MKAFFVNFAAIQQVVHFSFGMPAFREADGKLTRSLAPHAPINLLLQYDWFTELLKKQLIKKPF